MEENLMVLTRDEIISLAFRNILLLYLDFTKKVWNQRRHLGSLSIVFDDHASFVPEIALEIILEMGFLNILKCY